MARATHTTSLRKVGGSVMLSVPPALLNVLGLRPGAEVGIGIESGRLVVAPPPRHRYMLDELLAHCDAGAPRGTRERAWVKGKPLGRELI